MARDPLHAVRFPFLSIGIFVLVCALTLITWSLTGSHCAFGFGGYQCNGWVGSFSGMLFGWSLLSFLLLPLSLVIALWRIVRWTRR